MGAQHARELAQPQVDKLSGDGCVEHQGCPPIRYGYCSCQGWRREMEDAHSCVDKIEALPGCSYFAVFDGHGGAGAAHFASASLLPKIVEHVANPAAAAAAAAAASAAAAAAAAASAAAAAAAATAAAAASASGSHLLPVAADNLHERLAAVVPSAFIAMDEYMSDHIKEYCRPGDTEDPGTTAVTSIITPSHVVFAHIGDARAMLCRNGTPAFVTQDHKPDHPDETKRIEGAGGFVAAKRVCRCLAVSRAFGDHYFKNKEQPPQARMVSCVPDVSVVPRQPEDEFIFLACDGVWDVMTAEQVCTFVRDKLLGTDNISEVCSAIVDHCIRKGSTDNITAVLVCLSGAKNGAAVRDMIDSWFGDISEDSEEGGASRKAIKLQGDGDPSGEDGANETEA